MKIYPLIEGEVAFVKATDEPVFVVTIADNDVLVRRATQSSVNGVNYSEEHFLPAELQTEKARVIREMEAVKFSTETRDRYTEEYQKAKSAMKAAIPAIAIPQADGNGGLLN